VNVAVGFGIGFVSNITVLPLFGMHVQLGANFEISLIFTVISLIRSFALRRLFNRLTTR
jgi:hypothetical protein